MLPIKKTDVQLNKWYISNHDNDVNYYGDNENNDNYSNHFQICGDKDDNVDELFHQFMQILLDFWVELLILLCLTNILLRNLLQKFCQVLSW